MGTGTKVDGMTFNNRSNDPVIQEAVNKLNKYAEKAGWSPSDHYSEMGINQVTVHDYSQGIPGHDARGYNYATPQYPADFYRNYASDGSIVAEGYNDGQDDIYINHNLDRSSPQVAVTIFHETLHDSKIVNDKVLAEWEKAKAANPNLQGDTPPEDFRDLAEHTIISEYVGDFCEKNGITYSQSNYGAAYNKLLAEKYGMSAEYLKENPYANASPYSTLLSTIFPSAYISSDISHERPPRNIFQKISDGISSTVKVVADAVGNVVSKVAGAVSSVAKKVAEAVSNVVKKVAQAVSETVKKVAKAVSDTVKRIAESVSKTVKKISKSISDTAKKAWESVKKVWKTVTGQADPIVVDLDGDGAEVTEMSDSAAKFDFDDDGLRLAA